LASVSCEKKSNDGSARGLLRGVLFVVRGNGVAATTLR
jgi:hypothetical protein